MLSEAWEEGKGGPGEEGGGGGEEIPATCENSQTQTITGGQLGYQEAEVGQGEPMSVKGFNGTLESTTAFVDHKC